jgi:hypothetical protein
MTRTVDAAVYSCKAGVTSGKENLFGPGRYLGSSIDRDRGMQEGNCHDLSANHHRSWVTVSYFSQLDAKGNWKIVKSPASC